MSEAPAPPRAAFPWYLTASSLWMAGMSLQGFLFTWLLVGILERPADETSFARAIAEFPPLIMLLLGGMLGDRSDGRSYLLWMHGFMTLPPLLIAMIFNLGLLSYWWVVLFGVLMAGIQSLSDPARQAALSRVSRFDVQRAVTIMTITTSLVGLSGFVLGGLLDTWGLTVVLVLQAALFALGSIGIAQLPSLPPAPGRRPNISEGIAAVWQLPLVRNIIGLNFLSSLFNAGAYIIAIPYIAKEVYGGDAAFLAQVMIVFTIGSIGSNLILLAFMPLRHPGRLFLFMQLTRVLILVLVWIQPSLWLFYVALFAWGLNMGVTTTMVRTTVQELAPAQTRAQILSILLLSFMVSSPISSIVLGYVIVGFSPLAAMVPGMVMSLIIFAIGITVSGLWQYDAQRNAASVSAAPGR